MGDLSKSMPLQQTNKISVDIMPKPQPPPHQIHECAFEAHVLRTDAAVKFSCRMFVSWKTTSNKLLAKTTNPNVTVVEGVATFNQKLPLCMYMVWDKNTGKYLSKETSLCLLLVSARKPDQEKLVGRVVVDLAEVLNSDQFTEQADHKLSFCSIRDASLRFRIRVLSRVKTELLPSQVNLDQSLNIERLLEHSSMADSRNELPVERVQQNVADIGQNAPEIPAIAVQQNFMQQVHVLPAEEDIRQQVQVQVGEGGNNQYNGRQGQKPQQNNQGQTYNEQQPKVQQQPPYIQAQVRQLRTHRSQQQLQPQPEPNNTDNQTQKLRTQNQKLIQIIQQISNKLSQQQQQSALWHQKYQELQTRHIKIQNQTKQIVDQLERQLDDLSHRSLQQQVQVESELEEKIEFLKRKYRKRVKQLQESQGKRLAAETELLEARYELAEVKGEREVLEEELKNTIAQCDRLKLESQGKNKIEDSQGQQRFRELEQQLQQANIQITQLNSIKQQYQSLKNTPPAIPTVIQQKQDTSQLHNQIKSLQQQLKAAQNQLIRYQSQRIQLQTQNKHLQSQYAQLQEKLQNNETALVQANKQLERNFHQAVKTGQAMDVLQGQVDDYRHQLENAQGFRKSAEQQVEKQRTATSELVKQIKELKQIKQKKEKDNSAQQLIKLQKQLQSRQRQAQDKAKQYQAQLSRLQAQISQNNKRIQNLQKDNQAYRQKMTQNTSANLVKVHDAQRKIIQLNQQIKTKQGQVTQLNNKLSNEMLRNQELEERISKFSDKEAKMRQSISILEEQSRKIYDIVMEKQQREEQQDQLLQEKITELERLEEQLYEKQVALQSTIDELNDQKRQVYELRKEMFSSRSSPAKQQHLSNGLSQHGEQFDRLLQINALSEQRIQELEKQVLSVTGQKNREIESLLGKISYLQAQLHNNRDKARSLQQYLQDIRNKNNDLSNQLDNMRYSQKTIQSNSSMNEIALNNRLQEILRNSEAKQAELYKIIEEKQEEIMTSKKLVENLKVENNIMKKSNSKLGSSIVLEKTEQDYEGRAKQLQKENLMMEAQLAKQQAKLSQVQGALEEAHRIIQVLRNQVEESQVQKMNVELQKQFDQASREQNSQVKSSNAINPDMAGADLVQACRTLQELIKQRVEKDKVESIIELMTVKHAMLEDELAKITQQRGTIQQNARSLSMQLQKIKSKILKGKGNFQDKNELISSLRPCELKVRDLVVLTEKLFEAQMESEAY